MIRITKTDILKDYFWFTYSDMINTINFTFHCHLYIFVSIQIMKIAKNLLILNKYWLTFLIIYNAWNARSRVWGFFILMAECLSNCVNYTLISSVACARINHYENRGIFYFLQSKVYACMYVYIYVLWEYPPEIRTDTFCKQTTPTSADDNDGGQAEELINHAFCWRWQCLTVKDKFPTLVTISDFLWVLLSVHKRRLPAAWPQS